MLWFSPSQASLYEHNPYGNVSFEVSMNDVASRFKYTYYYLDKIEFENRISTRIILSKKALNLTEIDMKNGSAPIKIEDFSYKYAIRGASTTYSAVKKHILEIGVDVDDDDCKWLYNRATISTNDHSRANHPGGMFGDRELLCHKYNTFSNTCPYPLSKDEADKLIRKMDPRFASSR